MTRPRVRAPPDTTSTRESRSRNTNRNRDARRRPKDYFLQQLVGKGVRVDPKPLSFKNPDSKITCVALKYRTTDELPEGSHILTARLE